MYETETGSLERYSPLLNIRLPEYLQRTKLELNLINNKDRLISFFDLHQTLSHFIFINSSINANRGISLFNKIPSNRSCSDALIPSQQCMLNNYRLLTKHDFKNKTEIETSLIVEMIISNLNAKTETCRSICSKYTFDEIKSIYYVDDLNIYKFKLKLQPGDSTFESSFKIRNGIIMLDDFIYRLSIYWKTSNCMKNEALKPYCHCI